MTGTFRDRVGEFLGHAAYGGRVILVRCRWTRRGTNAAPWEPAFSADAARTWETNWVMNFTRAGGASERRSALPDVAPSTTRCCEVVELRQYTLHAGTRETRIDLFDREFVETQEATGMRVMVQFLDVDRPHVFTWLRGFPDVPSRAASLGACYGGPVWAAHKDAANAAMISSDSVRLLRHARPGSGLASGKRAGLGAAAGPGGFMIVTIYTLHDDVTARFADFFECVLAPRLAASGAAPIATFETVPSANTFPRPPVREGEHVFGWFARFNHVAIYDRHVVALAADPCWSADARPVLARLLTAPPAVWRLTPTARSRAVR